MCAFQDDHCTNQLTKDSNAIEYCGAKAFAINSLITLEDNYKCSLKYLIRNPLQTSFQSGI
jgi:hypothetical protein